MHSCVKCVCALAVVYLGHVCSYVVTPMCVLCTPGGCAVCIWRNPEHHSLYGHSPQHLKLWTNPRFILQYEKSPSLYHPPPPLLPLAPPTTSPLPIPTTTCSALQSIPLTTGGRSCSVRPTCDQLDCTVLGYTAGFIVLPCNSPPAVAVIINSSANSTVFYQVVSSSQRVPLFGLTALDITVEQLNNSLGFKVM